MPTKNSSQLEKEQQECEALVEQVFQSAAGVMKVFSIYLGHKLGYYGLLASGKAMTSGELAKKSHTHERYAREWLEQQTVAGIIEVDDENLEPKKRRYILPPGHSEALTNRESLNYITPLAQLLVGAAYPISKVIDAYKTGKGVAYEDYGADLVEGQREINRPIFLYQLSQEWLPLVRDIHRRLQSDPPARVADIGCGVGWSSIGMALGYSKIQVDGFDLDRESINQAKINAKDKQVEKRVKFYARDAGDSTINGQYDLVTAFECIHDMSNPVQSLRIMRQLAGVKGTVLVIDERVEDKFTAKGNNVEWLMYGWSILHCLPVGMSEQPSAGTGTVMRPPALLRYAKKAGFRDLEILPIDHFFFRIYRLKV